MDTEADSEEDIAILALVAVESIEVVELTPADEEVTDEEEVEVDFEELPDRVLAALEAEYPGAEILEAEMEQEDGETEYDVLARFEGQSYEVGLTPDGRITEISQVLSQGELPREVVEWLEANFPGAEISEIELVNEDGLTSYELQIAPLDAPAVEATVRVTAAPADDPVANPEGSPIVVTAGDFPEPPLDGGQQLQAIEAQAEATADEAAGSSPADGVPAVEAEAPVAAVALPERGGAGEAVPRAQTEQAALDVRRREGSAERSGKALPELGLLLVRASTFDVRDIDQQLQQLLVEIDKLARGLAGSEALDQAGLKLALIAAVIAGAQLFRPDRRLRRTQLLSFTDADADWSWTVWSATTMRK